jgi:hypothetical protein
MMVGMVDSTSWWRPPTPTPPRPNPINQLMRGTDTNLGYSRANQDLVNRRGGEMFLAPFSTLTDEAKNTGALQRGTPASYALTPAAFVADFLNPSFGLPIGVGGVSGAKTAAADPANQARLNAMMGRMYHGVRGDDWTVAKNRPFSERAGNWFNGDLFVTSDLPLANSYGVTTVKKIKNLPKDLKVLDLMPGGPPIAQQSAELAQKFAERNLADIVGDAQRHLPFTSLTDDFLKEALESQGFNALRHISGQGLMYGGASRAKPVYVFFNPEGITSAPISATSKALSNLSNPIKKVEETVRKTVKSVPEKLIDSVYEALRRQDAALLPPKAQEFLKSRGMVVQEGVSGGGVPQRISPEGAVSPFRPYEGLANTIEFLGKPAQAVRGARQASLNAYQKMIDNYSSLEAANRQTFLNNSSYGQQLLPSGRPMYGGGNKISTLDFPMPPGYTPLPQPAQPGALDFLKYLFAQ